MPFALAMQLYDKVTWGQVKTPEFETREEAQRYCDLTYPGMVRPDLFHGLQKVQIVETKPAQ